MSAMPSQSLAIRFARPGDEAAILDLIRELAEYERLLHEVIADAASLTAALFAERPVAEALLAEMAGHTVGFALFFRTFSTFVGRPGHYLEDLYVKVDHRGRGIGRALLQRLAQLTVERGYGRLEWAVLNWNTPAIGFYERLGSRAMDEWAVHRLSGPALEALAGR
jgi:GNAT superfamily N-acetyltransferase